MIALSFMEKHFQTISNYLPGEESNQLYLILQFYLFIFVMAFLPAFPSHHPEVPTESILEGTWHE